jgi:hypothetical protein
MYGTNQQKSTTSLGLNFQTFTLTKLEIIDGQFGKQLLIELNDPIKKLKWINVPSDKVSDSDLLLINNNNQLDNVQKEAEILKLNKDLEKAKLNFVNYTLNFTNAFGVEIIEPTYLDYIESFSNFAKGIENNKIQVLLIPDLRWDRSSKTWVFKKLVDKQKNFIKQYTSLPDNPNKAPIFIKSINDDSVTEIPKYLNDAFKLMLEHNQSLSDSLMDDSIKNGNDDLDWDN